jgi:hypothetical protein
MHTNICLIEKRNNDESIEYPRPLARLLRLVKKKTTNRRQNVGLSLLYVSLKYMRCVPWLFCEASIADSRTGCSRVEGSYT